ncbi:hypothetical protein [Corynebacterium sp. H113]|uniref:hypothetical protein n=1 Tax=Corynebacterium sp. H113 TaxID=3133419 RepID=UPI0030B5EDEA
MGPQTVGELLTGGALTSLLAIIGLWVKVRKDSKDAKTAAVDTAVEASRGAVDVMSEAMEVQKLRLDELSQRMTVQDTTIADMSVRLTDVTRRHQAAVEHIAHREAWTRKQWPNRPKDLESVPLVIVAEVQAVDPTLRLLDELTMAGEDEEIPD